MNSSVARWRPAAGWRKAGPEPVAGVPVLRLTLELPLPVTLPLLARTGVASSLWRRQLPAAALALRPRLSLWAGTGAVIRVQRPGAGPAPELPAASDGFATAMRRGAFLFVPLGGSRALGREWRIYRLALRCRALLAPRTR